MVSDSFMRFVVSEQKDNRLSHYITAVQVLIINSQLQKKKLLICYNCYMTVIAPLW
jgi:hypothetical protein